MKQIGWVIKSRVDRTYHSELRVYSSEKIALRYSNGLPVIPCYVESELC